MAPFFIFAEEMIEDSAAATVFFNSNIPDRTVSPGTILRQPLIMVGFTIS